MKYLGIARKEADHILMPDAFQGVAEGQTFEALELGGDILLSPPPLDRQRLAQVERLARQSIDEHRRSLEDLAR